MTGTFPMPGFNLSYTITHRNFIRIEVFSMGDKFGQVAVILGDKNLKYIFF
jgi:hypothetical protein